jgi:hypothetical protein
MPEMDTLCKHRACTKQTKGESTMDMHLFLHADDGADPDAELMPGEIVLGYDRKAGVVTIAMIDENGVGSGLTDGHSTGDRAGARLG